MEDPEQQAEKTLEELEAQSEEVGEHIDDTRSDWERKQQDAAVPGAEPGEEADAEDVAGDWEGQGPNASDAGQ
jgi:hypothetical protein